MKALSLTYSCFSSYSVIGFSNDFTASRTSTSTSLTLIFSTKFNVKTIYHACKRIASSKNYQLKLINMTYYLDIMETES